MTSGFFDATLKLGPLAISPHFFLESLAYLAGFALYRRERSRAGDFRPQPFISTCCLRIRQSRGG